MFVAVSINAIDSISICENPDLVADANAYELVSLKN